METSIRRKSQNDEFGQFADIAEKRVPSRSPKCDNHDFKCGACSWEFSPKSKVKSPNGLRRPFSSRNRRGYFCDEKTKVFVRAG